MFDLLEWLEKDWFFVLGGAEILEGEEKEGEEDEWDV